MMTAAEVTSANWPQYAGCVVFVLFVIWLIGEVWR